MNKDRFLVVVSGPSGAGKDTVVAELRKAHPEIERSISATTRAMREGEENGVNYFYLSKEEFKQKISDGEMLEYTIYCDNYYGTPKFAIDAHLANKKTVVLVIEVNGAENVKKMYGECTTIFVNPPSIDELEDRLRGRQTETESVILQRLKRAELEMEYAKNYDFTVINDDIDKCAQEIHNIIKQRQNDSN